jgi:hypothetical protein
MFRTATLMYPDKASQFRIGDSHNGGYEQFYFREYDALLYVENKPNFRRNTSADIQQTTWRYTAEDRILLGFSKLQNIWHNIFHVYPIKGYKQNRGRF